MKFVVNCCRRRTASSRSAAESWMKSLVSCGRKRCWWPRSRGKTSRRWLLPPPAIVVPETLDPINLLGVLRRARGSFVIVTNEFGVVQGLVTPLDVLEAIAGEFPDADETPEIVIDGDGWLIKGSTDLHALQQALGLDPLINDDEDIATVAGLVISANGHIPRIGDVVSLPPLHFTVVEANDYRVDLVRAVVTRPPSDEEE
ncbi:hypothetical protein LN650_11935 [Klebsiella pneumoniae subsp. pneumoniae]|nr:hypothetical protein [Klebsiella pneumoniae subsp. pneumoniae]